MTIKLKLSSGKEIVLTEDEYDELVESLKVEEEVEKYVPYDPYEPQIGWPPQAWYEPYVHIPTVWQEPYTWSGTGTSIVTYDSETVGDITNTKTVYSDGSILTTSSCGDAYSIVNAVCSIDAGEMDQAICERYGCGLRNGKGNGRGRRMTTGNNWD